MNNNVTLVGYVGQNPTTIEFDSGKKVVKFSIAVKEYTASDEQPQTMWIDIQAWNSLGTIASAHVTKGREIVVQGRLALTQYIDKNGRDITKPVINLSSFHLCGRKLEITEFVNSQLRSQKNKKRSKEIQPDNCVILQ